jgi:GWxTD domain-containing protein
MMRRIARVVLLLAVPALLAQAAGTAWLDRVSPIITPAEKKTYLGLKPGDRAQFEERFWADKAISAQDYFQRLQYVDSMFGSGKVGSGANTDEGRVFLALGAPTRVTHLPSSRIFVPLDIWYYDIVPGVINTEVRLMFYQPRSVGYRRLYSPTGDTIRALLVPQAATRSAFGPNDSITENDIRSKLLVPPAEDEVVTAAVNVATGIRATGNDELIGRISSPVAMLGHAQKTLVQSRLIVAHPRLDVVETASSFGGSQIDLSLETPVQKELDVEVLEDATTVYQNKLHLKFATAETVHYVHRLDLLPGAYRVLITVDGKAWPYPLTVGRKQLGLIYRADKRGAVEKDKRQTPFEFDGEQIELKDSGKFAMVTLPQPGKVRWMLRHGSEVVWRNATDGRELAMVELPTTGIAPGTYNLEAVTETDSRITEVQMPVSNEPNEPTGLSFNANLIPALRYASVGHQWLLRGNVAAARKSLEDSIAHGQTEQAMIELARAEALAGNLDEARTRVKSILAKHPDSFEALSTFAYIETKLQDYQVAAELYRKALDVQESPVVRAALAQLPGR